MMTKTEEQIESKRNKEEMPKPKHIVFQAKAGIYFGRGQTL
jgi:hypothetical protein